MEEQGSSQSGCTSQEAMVKEPGGLMHVHWHDETYEDDDDDGSEN